MKLVIMNTSPDPDLPSNLRLSKSITGCNDSNHSQINQSVEIQSVPGKELSLLAECYMKAYQGLEKYGEPSLDKANLYLRHLYHLCPDGFFKIQVNEQLAGFIKVLDNPL